MSQPLERYWATVMDNPKRADEGVMSYIARIAEIVEGQGLDVPAKPMAELTGARMPYRDSE